MRRDLEPGPGLWRDGRKKILSFASMDSKHLHNCRRFASDSKLREIDAELNRRVDPPYDSGAWA